MDPTRRDFCQAGLAGAVALVLGGCNDGTSGAPLPATGKPLPPETTTSSSYALTLSAFEPQLGTQFAVFDASGTRGTLTLVGARDEGIGVRAIVDRGECFSLSFESSGSLLDQDTYQLSHPAIGEFPLFIVPGRPGSRPTYTAIFNRI